MRAKCNSARVRPLPAAFLAALENQEEVRVTSRDGAVHGTVPMWFLVEPPGVVYLFTQAFSVKARRWQKDPWVRLSVRSNGSNAALPIEASVAGEAHFVSAEELDDELAERIVEHWSMQGAPTVQGLRRTLRDRVHALIRVESPRPVLASSP
jgi:general stress protein 26